MKKERQRFIDRVKASYGIGSYEPAPNDIVKRKRRKRSITRIYPTQIKRTEEEIQRDILIHQINREISRKTGTPFFKSPFGCTVCGTSTSRRRFYDESCILCGDRLCPK